jgi:hypothetical protein
VIYSSIDADTGPSVSVSSIFDSSTPSAAAGATVEAGAGGAVTTNGVALDLPYASAAALYKYNSQIYINK